MKYFECVVDNGDGSNTTHRFKTKEDAEAWLADKDEADEFDCYPLGPLTTVDTDAKWFWSWPDPWSS